MTRSVHVGFLALAATIAVAASAGSLMTAQAKDDGTRFSMERTEDGMLRLDRQTGAMSLCRSRSGAWACSRIEDDSAGLEAEISDLKADNRKLREENARLQAQLDRGDDPRIGSGDRPARQRALPTEKDVDRAFSFLEGVLKRFKGMVEDLDDRRDGGTPL